VKSVIGHKAFLPCPPFFLLIRCNKLPHRGYSLKDYDPTTMVLASGRDVPISYKKSVNVCRAIRGLRLEQAKNYLNKVIEKREPVPFVVYRKKVAHKRALGGPTGAAGRYPVRASKAILKVLLNAENNATQKGMESSSLMIVHAAAQKARVLPRSFPRAFGRMSTKRRILTHVEIGLKQIKE
jgi:large subunit ribosomal protein L22